MPDVTFKLALTPAERSQLYRTWREQFAKRQSSALDFLLYALLRGRDPLAGFTPIRNPRKLSNGMQAQQSYRCTVLAASNMAGHLLSARLRALFPTASRERLAELVGGVWHSATVLYASNQGAYA